MTTPKTGIVSFSPSTLVSINTPALVDRFGRLKANASDIADELDGIKETLIEREGECKLEGELFRLSLANTLRSTTDWKAVAQALAKKAGITDKALDALIASNTNCTAAWVARSNARITKKD
jgi:hypothetical protein